MLNLNQGISLNTDSPADKRRMTTDGPATRPAMPSPAGRPAVNYQVNLGAAPTRSNGMTQFTASNPKNAMQSQQQPATLMGLMRAMLSPGANFSQIAGQILSFFKGNSRDVRNNKDDREEHQRQLNDEAAPSFMGESKVEQSNGASMGGGGR